MVFSRSRVAPVRGMTIPRMELVACLLAARPVRKVFEAFRGVSPPIFAWSDSTVALSWIHSKSVDSLPVFVRNRVKEINKLLDVSSWRHCEGALNPADLPSRGCSLQALISSPGWWEGPEFIRSIPDFPYWSGASEVQVHLSSTEKVESGPDPLMERFSSLRTLTRVKGWVLRFVRNVRVKGSKKSGNLDPEELEESLNTLVREEQRRVYPDFFEGNFKGPLELLRPSVDEWGMVEVNPRNGESALPLLPQGPLARLIIEDRHRKVFHGRTTRTLAEVLTEFHLPRGREFVKRVLRECRPCRRFVVPPLVAEEGALPDFRSKARRPFSACGCDFFGPLMATAKAWVLMFVCSISRGIHLELVEHADAIETTLAFRRFVGRRGLPRVVNLDNARTFKAVASKAPEGVRFRFNPVAAPHFGGHFERLVGTCKRGLRTVLRGRKVSFRELETILVELEMVVNSRPLTYVSELDEVLTPNHFLLGLGPDLSLISRDVEPFTQAWRARRSLANNLWVRWRKEYLTSLRSWRRHELKDKPLPKVGDVCLVRLPNSPRGVWPIGRITRLLPGQQGHVRAVELQLRGRKTTRPLRELCQLEV